MTNAVGAGSKEVQNKEPQQVAPVPIPLPRNITRMVGKPAPTEVRKCSTASYGLFDRRDARM